MNIPSSLDYATYRRLRVQYQMTPQSIHRYLSSQQQQPSHEPIAWQTHPRTGNKMATLRLDGFTVHITVEPDTDYDWTDCRGTFTNQEQEGALPNPGYRYDHRLYKYFVPMTTEEEHYQSLRKMNYGKAIAREMAHSYVLQDLKIAADPDRAGYYVVGVVAKAMRKGIELGEASVWGTELGYGKDDEEYLTTCAWEEAHEAVEEAKKNLTALLDEVEEEEEEEGEESDD